MACAAPQSKGRPQVAHSPLTCLCKTLGPQSPRYRRYISVAHLNPVWLCRWPLALYPLTRPDKTRWRYRIEKICRSHFSSQQIPRTRNHKAKSRACATPRWALGRQTYTATANALRPCPWLAPAYFVQPSPKPPIIWTLKESGCLESDVASSNTSLASGSRRIRIFGYAWTFLRGTHQTRNSCLLWTCWCLFAKLRSQRVFQLLVANRANSRCAMMCMNRHTEVSDWA